MLGLTVAGALTGAAIGSSRHVDRVLTPSLDFIATVPGAAFVPVAVLMFGTGWGLLLVVGASGYLTATVLAHVEARVLRNWQRSDQ